MKNVIYYFSGTGNSLKVAKEIAAGLPDCEVISVSSSNPKMPDQETERIGFVYPTYGAGLPHMMAKFVCDMDFTNISKQNMYVFAVATCGYFPLNAVRDLPTLLRLKGFLLSYGSAVRMPENYILMFNRPANAEEILKNSEAPIRRITSAVLKKETMKKIGKPIPLFRLFHLIFMNGIKKTAKKYTVSDACTGCGQCMKLCPSGNISLTDGKPAFGTECEACMACIQHCPVRAINHKKDLSRKERYVHPEITAEEMMEKNR